MEENRDGFGSLSFCVLSVPWASPASNIRLGRRARSVGLVGESGTISTSAALANRILSILSSSWDGMLGRRGRQGLTPESPSVARKNQLVFDGGGGGGGCCDVELGRR